ncbi:hypothetical protein [Gordonia insulae]|uniref:hypothetical protein n=1 Tax=Gordonia insulae TaxID=2420509 RepID=UPI0013DD88F5|nr:hypothetical protein [Gordonia insulae]
MDSRTARSAVPGIALDDPELIELSPQDRTCISGHEAEDVREDVDLTIGEWSGRS